MSCEDPRCGRGGGVGGVGDLDEPSDEEAWLLGGIGSLINGL